MGFFNDCDPDERFLAWESLHSVDPPRSTWLKYDLDQRRCINVNIEGNDPDGNNADQVLAKHINSVGEKVVSITASADATLLSSSNDPELDEALLPAYPLVDTVPVEFRDRAVKLEELVELSRIGPCVDLVVNRNEAVPLDLRPRFVLKSHVHWKQFIWCWHEMNCTMKLSLHPNVVSFDRVVTAKTGPDDRERIVGFTMEYIEGGNLEENRSRIFKLKYLTQLMSLVDDLNLKYGIVHQDIAPDNLVLDSSTDTLKLLDFGFSARLGWAGHEDNFHVFRDRGDRDDIKGVVFSTYEILTGDWHYNSKPLHRFPTSEVLAKNWTQGDGVSLDRPISEFRGALDQWVATRRAREASISHYSQLPDHLDWPLLGDDVSHQPLKDQRSSDTTPATSRLSRSRREAKRRGERYLVWTRPAHDQIPEGCFVLANGDTLRVEDL